VETEDASLNKEVIGCGSPDHDCYIGRLTRQYEVVIAIEALVLAEVAVPKFQSVSEAELFRDKVKNLRRYTAHAAYSTRKMVGSNSLGN
jgi:hypothetical protein